ncbi:SDR family oxidoreductase [Pedobacter sp. MC2016-14]|uniref:SDR family NAD(P)-dependent oxidoreductase n=1 Tax=Pedobacter sp. MC2016-14 TaxID=2897327 RepID=UPI001E4DDB8C|nr:SDR family oxidoreductase [Pedobacter sp. MC2016-14]MCD0487241.1 SDR family oxidoreductase [Pedobacter sp. MC2016-14]
MQLLKDKIIFLTGGSKGIGFECAKKYVEAGATLAIVSNDDASLVHCQELFGSRHTTISCDVSNAADVEKAINYTVKKFGRIDAIHNNAGIANPSKPLHDTTAEEWEALFNVNLKSMFYTTKFGLKDLIASEGCILTTSSLVAEIGQENHAAYTATKGAINALTKSMALDYAKYKIRVNAVAPAGVWTPMLEEWATAQENAAEIKEYLDKIHALNYCPAGDVIADACVFLLSDKARFMTGVIMPVSGGAELGYRRSN